ncbi:hypothetical protein [Aliihoeflea aestuarii]|uniref:hypothetical protein n=1 Tax=Aliihoeflea aestuarii TaxID=453840 RepID=UPI0020921FBE|nr:hypothetical protein [Aliihoeflea aestuarii]
MATTQPKHASRLAILLAGALACAAPSALAQGLDSEGAIDTIVDSEVKTEELSATEESGRVVTAIDASLDNAQIVRRAFNIEEVDIVFLPGVGAGDSGISEKRAENADQIVELQQAIEGSAIFYHAVNSRQILVRDIVAIEFENENRTATIFVAGAEPGTAVPEAPADEPPAEPEAAPDAPAQ